MGNVCYCHTLRDREVFLHRYSSVPVMVFGVVCAIACTGLLMWGVLYRSLLHEHVSSCVGLTESNGYFPPVAFQGLDEV